MFALVALLPNIVVEDDYDEFLRDVDVEAYDPYEAYVFVASYTNWLKEVMLSIVSD